MSSSTLKWSALSEFCDKWLPNFVCTILNMPSLFSGEENFVPMANIVKQVTYWSWCAAFIGKRREAVNNFANEYEFAVKAMVDDIRSGATFSILTVNEAVDRAALFTGSSDVKFLTSYREKCMNFSTSDKWREIDEEWQMLFIEPPQQSEEKQQQNQPVIEVPEIKEEVILRSIELGR